MTRSTRGRPTAPAPAALALVLLLSILGAVAPAAVGAAGPGPATTLRAATAIVPGTVNRSSLHLRATYLATLRLDYGTRRFAVTSSATITNASGAPIDRVELNTAVARLGGMRLGTVTVDGTAVAAKVVDQTIVVPLGGILPVGATTVVRLSYTATLRTSLLGSSWLFTKANGIVVAYRWLPWVSRQTAFDRPNHGDPFVTPVSSLVDVTIITDRKLVIATTGDRQSRSSDGRTQRYIARDVRDFTVTAAPDFHIRETTVGDTIIRYYYRSSTNAAAILDGAVDAFRAIQSRLGDYPYPTFKVVQSAGGYGMESPRMIWVPYGLASANVRYLTAHETAHQWFYGLVGNDQSTQPFADEAAADFIARSVTGLKRSSRCSTGRLDKTIYEYTATCYYEKVYIQGGNVIDAARRAMGSTAFWRALKGYVTANRYGFASNATLLTTLDRATTKDLAKLLFASRFPRIY